MEFKRKAPPPQLTNYVRYLWYFEVKEEDIPFTQLYFPFGSFELAHHVSELPKRLQYIDGAIEKPQPTLFYSGQFTRSFYLSFDKPCKCIGVSFFPWAGNTLFPETSSSFGNEMIHLNDIEPSNRLEDKLHECRTIDEYHKVLENYILNKIDAQKLDVISEYLSKEIIRAPRKEDIVTAIKSVGLSRRRIEQRFALSTGLSIGMFTKKIRFQRSVTLLKENRDYENLTQMGLKAGYYDQSHFIRDFKDFAGVTPSAFIDQRHDLKEFLKSLL